MDTIFWQKLIRPMTQPDAPPFFLLDALVPWQKQVLDCLHESWKAVSDEPFDYENRVRYYLSLALRLKTGEIGAECGFTDGSYFIKIFREIKHCTPKEYRMKFC